jgi:hypothetical protein
MELLGDVCQMEAHFGLFGDSVNLGTRSVHGLRKMYHRHGNHVGCTRCNSKVTWVKWKLVSVHMETTLISALVRCTVCAKRTTGIQILVTLYDTPS